MKLSFGSAARSADSSSANNIEHRSRGSGAAEQLADRFALPASGLTAGTAATALYSVRSEAGANNYEAAIHTPEKNAKRLAVPPQSILSEPGINSNEATICTPENICKQ